jgi:prophage regulatory protein
MKPETKPPIGHAKTTDLNELNRIIRKKDLPKFTGLQRTTIDDLIRIGSFPKPIPLGKRSVGWLESELLDWQRARVAERDRQHFALSRADEQSSVR